MKDTAILQRIAHIMSLTEAKLHVTPNLHRFLKTSGLGISFFHPFYVAWLTTSNAFDSNVDEISKSIQEKEETFRELCAGRKWLDALYVVERPFRAEYLDNLIVQHGAGSMLSVIGEIWIDTETASDNQHTWENIWSGASFTRRGAPRKRLPRVMEKSEQIFLENLPERIAVYRGFSGDYGIAGMSWTLDRSIAEFFAYRSSRSGSPVHLASMEINKSYAIAYFSRRKESEILIRSWDFESHNYMIEELPARRSEAAEVA